MLNKKLERLKSINLLSAREPFVANSNSTFLAYNEKERSKNLPSKNLNTLPCI